MSEFKVEVLMIDDVIRHPNADSLAICKIRGFDCITSDISPGVERYKKGDFVAYIPEGAVVPDWLLQKMGFWDTEKNKGGLNGSAGNRVKAIKLRGIVSQGIMYPLDKNFYRDGTGQYDGFILVTPDGIKYPIYESQDVSELLNIIKYEPPVPVSMQGQVGAMFGWTKSYDIENVQNTNNLFEDGEEVVVTEKLHGTLSQNVFLRDGIPELPIPEDKKADLFALRHGVYAFVTSKGMAKQGFIQKNVPGNQENLYVRNFRENFLNNAVADRIANMLWGGSMGYAAQIFIFGEIFGPGVQSGYGYDRAKPDFRVFDVCIKEAITKETFFLSDAQLNGFCYENFLTRVPVLYRGPFSMERMIQLRDGPTIEGNDRHIREGIIIRSTSEKIVHGLPDNRKQVKMVSPAYLLKSTGEEFN